MQGQSRETPLAATRVLRAASFTAMLVLAGPAVAVELLCSSDAVTPEEMPPALRVEEPLFAVATTINLVRADAGQPASFKAVSVSNERLSAIGLEACQGHRVWAPPRVCPVSSSTNASSNAPPRPTCVSMTC